jgi:hypothetical protein
MFFSPAPNMADWRTISTPWCACPGRLAVGAGLAALRQSGAVAVAKSKAVALAIHKVQVHWRLARFARRMDPPRPINDVVQALELLGQRRTNAVPPGAISESLALWLMEWGLLGPEPQGDPEYTTMLLSVSNRIHAIRSYTESSGIHGDGTDWYEVELSPGMADQLRASLRGASAFKKTKTVHFPCQEAAPSWWPTQWPGDVRLYEKDSSYFVLPESGTRAGYMRFRSWEHQSAHLWFFVLAAVGHVRGGKCPLPSGG